jgi:NADH-quinone oxidoreductase subunit J
LADTLLFGIAAFVIVASALMVVLNRNPVHSALYLVLTFLGLAVVFWQLSAPFLAAVQVIVYGGAIMVLFTFVIMLLGEDKPMKGESRLGMQLPLGAFFSVCLVGIITYMLVQQPAQAIERPGFVEIIGGEKVPFGSVKALGNTLFTQYLFAFEATSVVLLIAMVGVVVLAKKRL